MVATQKKLLDKIPAQIRTTEVLFLINSGLIDSRYLLLLKQLSPFSDEIISSWLHINVKTYRAYKSKVATLKEDIQEHIVLLLALMKHGIDVFGDKDRFGQWLASENFQLGKKKPLVYLKTISGIKYIDDHLTGIEYGDNA